MSFTEAGFKRVVAGEYASGFVTHLEIYNRPPKFEFAEHGQKCFVGNINGGDSMPFSHLPALMHYLEREFHTLLRNDHQ